MDINAPACKRPASHAAKAPVLKRPASHAAAEVPEYSAMINLRTELRSKLRCKLRAKRK